ncbi:hypothetical protein RJ640_027613 [Escallonia rubra]|uniref:Protein kinase domain-containing protein n=1 Tax=Escallonia rubra TaxID=112253 RepID=A0AA88R0Q3_9ASTE|nr:hypothetical protein RJ640_027613 [Escallonia rubra]
MEDKYEKLEKVGEGTYEKVYKAKDKATAQLVTLKKTHLEMDEEGVPPIALREVSLLQMLSHSHYVVRLLCVEHDDNKKNDKPFLYLVSSTSTLISRSSLGACLLRYLELKGSKVCAHQLFDEMPHKNVVTWTFMISSYVQHGSFQLALGLFKEILASNEMPNQYTLFVVVRNCTVFGYVDLGVQIHGLIVCVGLERDEFAGSSLLDFYFKVMGDLGSAFRVFDGLYRIDVVTWNVTISGLAQDGDTSEVLRILSEMQVVDGLNPNDSTIVGENVYLVALITKVQSRNTTTANTLGLSL